MGAGIECQSTDGLGMFKVTADSKVEARHDMALLDITLIVQLCKLFGYDDIFTSTLMTCHSKTG